MTYQPFLIAPFKQGLNLDTDPWMLPEDAFASITNGHIHHGNIEKRAGYRELAETASTNSNFAITGASQTDPVVLTLTDVTALTNGDRIQVNFVVGMTELNGVQFLVANKTGGAGGTIELQDLNGNDIDGTGYTAYSSAGYVSIFPGDRIMGIARCYDSNGLKDTIVWDTKQGYYYDKDNGSLLPIDIGDIFDSDNDNYVTHATWNSANGTDAVGLNRIYFTNGKSINSGLNGLRYYTCAGKPTAPQAVATSLFNPSINGSATLNSVQFVFAIRQRLLILNTIEGSNSYPQRARWCQANNPGTPGAFVKEWYDNEPGFGGYVDAPTAEHIVSATQLQDIIIVWFTNSVWALKPTADPRLPFRWEKINSHRGSDAKMASYGFDRYAMSVSVRGITATDGNETKRVDDRIENFVTDYIQNGKFNRTFMGYNYQLRRLWILYSGIEEATTEGEVDAALILDQDSGAYSIYDIAMNVLGHAQSGVDYALDDFPDSPTELNPLKLPIFLNGPEYAVGEETLQDFSWEDSEELFIGGDINGKIFLLDNGYSDDGTNIEFELSSGAWNPFKGQGVKCEFGYLDFYVTVTSQTSFYVDFYKDNSDFPYISQQIDCIPNVYERARILEAKPVNPSTDGYIIKASNHGLSTNDFVYIYDIEGPSFLNGRQYQVTKDTEDQITLVGDFSGSGTTITGITQANPAVVTAVDHPFANGDRVIISGGDMVEVIGIPFTVANATVDTFELEGINSSAYTAYTYGAVVFQAYLGHGLMGDLAKNQNKVWKRAYGGGVGYWHQIKIRQEENVSPFKIFAFMPWFKQIGSRMI